MRRPWRSFRLSKLPLTAAPLVTLAMAAACGLWTTPADAFIYLTGSVSQSTTNVAYNASTMEYANAALDIDLGRFVRFGINYGMEQNVSQGYQPPQTTQVAGQPAPNFSCPTMSACVSVLSKSYIIERGAGFTVVLWDGTVFTPFVSIGAIVKTYTFETQTNGVAAAPNHGQTPPEPNLGAGLSIRLNKEFSLKITYQASPGVEEKPGDAGPHQMWDRKATVGLQFQI